MYYDYIEDTSALHLMHALIVLHGPESKLEQLYSHRSRYDFIIVTDGAANNLPSWLEPSIICGDFESINIDSVRQRYPQAEMAYLPDQNSSDLEKAILLARSRGARQITLCDGFGGRVDHSLCSLSVLIRYHSEFPIAALADDAIVRVLSPAAYAGSVMKLDTEVNDIVSLVSLVPCSNVSASNVQWPLAKFDLCAGTRGVSNRALGREVSVAIHSGLITVCHLNRAWCA